MPSSFLIQNVLKHLSSVGAPPACSWYLTDILQANSTRYFIGMMLLIQLGLRWAYLYKVNLVAIALSDSYPELWDQSQRALQKQIRLMLLQHYYNSTVATAVLSQQLLLKHLYQTAITCISLPFFLFPGFLFPLLILFFFFSFYFFKLYFTSGEKKIVSKRKYRRGENKEGVLSFSHIYSILEIEK